MSESPRSNNSKVNATDVDINSTKTTGVALDLKANSVTTGQALKVSATSVTGAGSAVEITGQAGQTALNVAKGDTALGGDLTITGGLHTPAPVIMTPAADVSITKATHAGRLLLIPSVATAAGKDNYKLPVAAAAGETYNFSWSGTAADEDNIQFQATAADAITFTGGLLDFDTNEAGVGGYVIVFPGANNDLLLLTNPQCFNITFTATTTTNYHVSGWAMSTDTASAFGDLSS